MNRRKFLRWAAALGTLGLAAAYPVFGERYMVMTNRYRIPVPNLPDAFNGFTIAHNPDSADTDHTGRVDLFICGHTHGG